MGRTIVIVGLVVTVVGLAWPWISKLGLGRLPGDFYIERDGWSFYFPLTSGLIVSGVLTLVLWLLRR